MRALKMTRGGGGVAGVLLRWTTNNLRVIIEADARKSSREVAEELNIDHSTVVRHLHRIGNSRKLDKMVNALTERNSKKFAVAKSALRFSCATKMIDFLISETISIFDTCDKLSCSITTHKQLVTGITSFLSRNLCTVH
jgi:DNA-binding CsgD family transcriptional regulator